MSSWLNDPLRSVYRETFANHRAGGSAVRDALFFDDEKTDMGIGATHGVPLRRPITAPSFREPFYQNLAGVPTYELSARAEGLGKEARPNSSASNKPSKERLSLLGQHPAIEQILKPDGSAFRTKELGWMRERDLDWRKTCIGDFRRGSRTFDVDRTFGYHYSLPGWSLESNMYGSWHHAQSSSR